MPTVPTTEGTVMPTRAHITLIVDRSGSMQAIRSEAEAGIKKFIEDQSALPGVKVKLSLYQFDDAFEHVFGPVKPVDAPRYRLRPGAMTALFDAIGKGIEDTRVLLDAAPEPKRPGKVVVVIMTDGFENASQEHTFESVTALIEAQKAAGWEFIFLAGHLQAQQFGKRSGLATRAYDPQRRGETLSAYAGASANTASYLTGDTATTANLGEPAGSSKSTQ